VQEKTFSEIHYLPHLGKLIASHLTTVKLTGSEV
jgi:hypothetical protein